MLQSLIGLGTRVAIGILFWLGSFRIAKAIAPPSPSDSWAGVVGVASLACGCLGAWIGGKIVDRVRGRFEFLLGLSMAPEIVTAII
jgi:hypothetical protein